MSLETLTAKLEHIYQDLSVNVTKIYGRQNLHLAIDLSFHSVLEFKVGGRHVKKGYVESLIVGDTRCGKTETAQRLVEHYQLGTVSGGENSSFAGLVGGLQQIRDRWQITWGKIPINDRRLLIIDEVSGIEPDEIAQMSGVRSSGVAEITKIHTEKTSARTRLVWMSNPRKPISINHFNNGIELIKDVIGKPEDIARFDFAIILELNDVDFDLINSLSTARLPHIYTSELCRNLILWAWSRKANEIYFDNAALDALYACSKQLYDKYSPEFPLVNPSEQKLKIARLAVALACRVFSTPDGIRVLVLPEHVEYITNFLNDQYDSKFFGLDMWSKNRREESDIKNEDVVRTELGIFTNNMLTQFLDMTQFNVRDLEDLLGCDIGQAKNFMHLLIKNNAVKKFYRNYIKTPALIRILREEIGANKQRKAEF